MCGRGVSDDNQKGRLAVVTGASSGIGVEIARGLAEAGFIVIMAVRDVGRGEAAKMMVESTCPAADIQVFRLDLADTQSISSFSLDLKMEYDSLDLLVNNAGVMDHPFGLTKDGFEIQFGTNHLGHFMLTGSLIDILQSTPGSRVVTQSSLARHMVRSPLPVIEEPSRYRPHTAYQRSKMANAMFALELDRRLKSAGSGTISLACHPGLSHTNIFRHSKSNAYREHIIGMFSRPTSDAALPALYAATMPGLRGGELLAPGGLLGLSAPPKVKRWDKASLSEEEARRLWDVSESMTGLDFGTRLVQTACGRVCACSLRG